MPPRKQRRQKKKKGQSFAHLPAPEDVEQTADPPIAPIAGRESQVLDTGQSAPAQGVSSNQSIGPRSRSSGDGASPREEKLPSGYYFRSSLSSLTPSRDELAFHRALQSGRNLPALRRATVEEVEDEGDHPQRRAQSTRHSSERLGHRRPESAPVHGHDDEAAAQLSTRAVRPEMVPLPEGSTTTEAKPKSSMGNPLNSLLDEYATSSGYTLPDEQRRAERRREKQRMRTRSNERSSLSKVSRVADGEHRRDAANWNEVNQRCIDEAIAREREVREDPVAFKRWCEELRRKENELRELRIAADHEYAVEMQANEDAKLAMQLDREEREAIGRRESAHREIADQKVQMAKLEEELRQRREATAELEAKIQDSVDRAARRALSRAGSQVGNPRAVPVGASDEHSSNVKLKIHSFNDRVILQRIRLQDLMKDGHSRYPDQGIDWDKNHKPFEVGSAPERGSSVGTCGGQKAALDPGNGLKKLVGSSPLRSQSFMPAAESSARNGPLEQRLKEPQPKNEVSAREFYTRPGYAPVPPSSGGSSSSSDTRSDRSDATYQPETNYFGSTDSDSAFDHAPGSESDSEDVTPEHNRNSPPHTRSGAIYRAGGMPPDDSGEGSSSSYGSDANNGGNRSSGRSPNRRRPGESVRSARHRRRRNTRCNHHSHGVRDNRMHLVEPGDPVSAGIPARNVKKWRRSLHRHYEQYLKETLGKRSAMQSVFDEHKNLKFPSPTSYNGSGDINKFDEHIMLLCHWMELLGLGGRRNDHKRVLMHGFYLSGPAKEWYEQNVKGMYRPKRNWTHIELILGLFDRFIDNACVQKATDSFWSTKYSPEVGLWASTMN
ncbi:hypothetical protein GGX14DRAFT_557298 [Mycena pura]|uniref:Uncharacterized protein n=1 Tax=Mycena pura TaxID=153505 RepID=A0AAD6YN81_9AGAR|nr:hypothetical protein GGX14DRAFT_557298 [Mycena pura]